MKVISEYSVKEILQIIGNNKYYLDGYNIKANSLRLQAFKANGVNCICCGRKGDKFKLEYHKNENPHLNLYSQNVLMTIDHIIPLSKGGNNDLTNVQILCTECNRIKDDKLLTIQELSNVVKNLV